MLLETWHIIFANHVQAFVSYGVIHEALQDLTLGIGNCGVDCGDHCAAGLAAPRECDPAHPTPGARTTICLNTFGSYIVLGGRLFYGYLSVTPLGTS